METTDARHEQDGTDRSADAGPVGSPGPDAGWYGYLVIEVEQIRRSEALSQSIRDGEVAVLDAAPALDMFAMAGQQEPLVEWRDRWLRSPPAWWGTRHHLPAWALTMELLEDGAGRLWLRPVGQGIIIEADPIRSTDFVADARSYGDVWDPRDCRSDVWPASWLGSHRIVARWSNAAKTLGETLALTPPKGMGDAARDYLAVECPACEAVAVPGTCCTGPVAR